LRRELVLAHTPVVLHNVRQGIFFMAQLAESFSTPLLYQDGSQTAVFEIHDVALRPGQRFVIETVKTPLLAGGFHSISPECGFHLSATLQLNHDLTGVDPAGLEKIAHAELIRKNSVNYSSYSVDLDSRVCVIANDAARLEKFLDTYGGIIDIEPLLVKGSHPQFPTVTELNLDVRGDGCRLDYQIKSAVNIDKCTYCGACGAVCPENCISENLFVDYSLCTLCRECEKVCQTEAIDIHGALGKTLEIPAVIMLGDLRVEIPGNGSRVYYEENLEEFFASLYPCQIDEVVSWQRSICQYSSRIGKGCDLCLKSCQYGAISQTDKGVLVDAIKCEECGACVASCPTGALQNQRFTDADFVSYMEAVMVADDATVVIGDELSLHALWWKNQGRRWENVFFLQYENIESLSLFHFLLLFNQGARRVVLVHGDAAESEKHSGSAPGRQLALASHIVSGLCYIDDAVLSCSIDNCAGILDTSTAGSFGRAETTVDFQNRRQALASQLQQLMERSGRQLELSPETFTAFATISCNEDRCTECMACLNDCRIGAMIANQEQLVLNHVGALCVGCGLCVSICPENALSISSRVTLAPPFFSEKTLARAEPMACKSCGKVFGTRKSFDKVMAILREKEAVDTSHFEYCETCRVVKLFESE
jgi:ferredoxin